MFTSSVGRFLSRSGWLGLFTIYFLLALLAAPQAERAKAPAYPPPDDRYKADILLIIAHPDDDTAIAGYLARAIFDEHRRVAVIVATRGEGGGNATGNERGAALGAEREVEARRALAFLGVTNVWFLGAPDTPAQDVLRSLEHWDHGSILGQTVRLVRLTRPDVVLTWLPVPVAGENHADHQAASVVANEAFDLAGDSTAFAEQLASSKYREHSLEGLRPWQPKKIYYFSDAFDAAGYWWANAPGNSPFRKNFLEKAGPVYETTTVSPSRHVSYAQMAAEETSFYLSQDGRIGKKALETNNLSHFEFPIRFVLGKSRVGGSTTADIFEGIGPEAAIAFTKAPGFQPQVHEGISLELGGPWAFYRAFWLAHDLERLVRLLTVPEVAIEPGGQLRVPVVIRNDTTEPQEVELSVTAGAGWTDQTPYSLYPVRPREMYPVQTVLAAPTTGNGWGEIRWQSTVHGQSTSTIVLRVCLCEGSMPQ
jgi:LmbE family N-acetylglucosaminyl deacetylase